MKAMRWETSAAWMMACALMACSSTNNNPFGNSTNVVRGAPPKPAGSGAPANPAITGTAGAADPLQGDNATTGVMAPPVVTMKDAGLKDGQCARQDITTQRITPIVWLVVDGSGSMVSTFGDSTRWKALRGALMDQPDGLVNTLQGEVEFGLIAYDGKLDFPVALPDGGVAMFSSPPATTCPRIFNVEPELNAWMDIDKALPPDPLGGSTPTDKALNVVVQHLGMASGVMLDQSVNPTIVVLATDGEPNDLCGDMGGGGLFGGMTDVKPLVLAQVKMLAQNNIKTYVISMAGDDMGLMSHLNDVAMAGATGKPPFVPSNKADLIQVFKDIIGPGAACDVKLQGKVKMGSECKGTLEINGTPLACDDDNGWRLKDESTITITGTACDMYRNDKAAMLHADFPCDAIIVN